MTLCKEQIIEILTWLENQGIESISKSIKFIEKNDISYVSPQKKIKFKGSSLKHEIINTKLRVKDENNELHLYDVKAIEYSKRFNLLRFRYLDNTIKEVEGGKAIFTLTNLTGDDLFKVLNF